MYKLTNGNTVLKIDETPILHISKDERNPKYQEHLAWLAEGNTPEPADPEPNPAIALIDAQLADIDKKTIRPMRAGETARVAELEAQAEALRAQRSLLPLTV